MIQKSKGAYKRMQKMKTIDTVRERERERESHSLVKLGYFFGTLTKIMIEK